MIFPKLSSLILCSSMAVVLSGANPHPDHSIPLKPHPEDILAYMLYHNQQFIKQHDPEVFSGQKEHKPFITFLGCSDARAQVQAFIPNPTNTVFSVRNIGNQLQTALGSLDYGIFHLKTPLLVVMGHTHCGAVQAALSNYARESNEIIEELDHMHIPLAPLIYRPKQASDVFEKLWIEGAQKNVDYQIDKALYRYQELVREKKLTIVGAIYDFVNHSQTGAGRLMIVNINGEKDPERLKKDPVLKKIPQALKNIAVQRYHESTSDE